jgi:hypothetical protein
MADVKSGLPGGVPKAIGSNGNIMSWGQSLSRRFWTAAFKITNKFARFLIKFAAEVAMTAAECNRRAAL